MTNPSGNPFYNSSTANSANSLNSSASRMALDNLLRRELKVADPNDSSQVAQALLARYKDTPKAAAISREAEGVPFLLASPTTPLMPQAATSSQAELQQAMDDVERDLKELTSNTILKDVTPELQGWTMAIRSAIQEGVNSARFALDRIQRDKTFGIRRMLGDYARMARLVGALTPSVNVYYRKLAQSLDEAAAVLLVMMGEALANVGFGSGRFLLQVPFSELQTRRDAVINALRLLVGSTQQSYDPTEFQRGLNAYRRLYGDLEQQGQGDLRVLLIENELSRMMDELIHRASHGNVEGLRALGATAQMDLERMRRLIALSQNIAFNSPPLATFLDTLLLFVQAFDSSGGFRLLRIARPAILSYGLYGTSGLDSTTEDNLVELTLYRNRLADQLDCFMQCGCGDDLVKGQIILDKILYDVDRAIDLYSVGSTGSKESTGGAAGPERRAAAYGFVVNQGLAWCIANLVDDGKFAAVVTGTNPRILLITPLEEILYKIQALLLPSAANFQPPSVNATGAITNRPPAMTAVSDGLMEQELCVQKRFEEQWINLVRTMAPGCIPFTGTNGAFELIQTLVSDARKKVIPEGAPDCPELDVDLPEHSDRSDETSAASNQANVLLAAATTTAVIPNNLKTQATEALSKVIDRGTVFRVNPQAATKLRIQTIAQTPPARDSQTPPTPGAATPSPDTPGGTTPSGGGG